MAQKTAPFGTWSSPITADVITQKAISFDAVVVDPVTSAVYHTEIRASGQTALVNTQTDEDVVAGDWNVRTGVQEYGGGAVIVYDGTVYFSNYTDGRVYKLEEGGKPTPITPDVKVYRYADFAVHPLHPHLLLAVREDHTHDTPAEVVNTLCVIDTVAQLATVLLSGADFYAAPRVALDGRHLAWQQWNHPDMPWEGGEVHVAELKVVEGQDGVVSLALGSERSSVGTAGKISACYPSWVSSETLLLTCDESGYQNPWIYTTTTKKFSPIFSAPLKEDFAFPPWFLGWSPYAVIDPDTALFMAYKAGRSVLYLVELKAGSSAHPVACPFVDISQLRALENGKREAVFSAQQAGGPAAIVLCVLTSLATREGATLSFTVLKSAADPTLMERFPAGILSPPRPMTVHVPPDQREVHVVYYAPQNPAYAGSSIPGERPPCVVNVHGGPTALETQGLRMEKQFFTSRGFAWLDVNYGGSSCYGRQYIKRLEGEWGVVDVADCISAAQAISSGPNALVDPARAVIRGGSSGGYAVLAALADAPAPDNAFFAAGASLYGISNLVLLAQDTHKFESHYMEKLLGGTYQEVPDVYEDRSPVNHADRIKSPLLILQGALDKTVPPEQAEKIVEAIKKNGGIYEYKVYEGEGHGWRKAETKEDALKRELAWYVKQLKIDAPEL